MKILLADKLHKKAVEAFGALPGAEVINKPSLGPDDLGAELPGVEILVVRSTKVTAAALQKADKLGLIIRAGSGVNTIDVETASSRGIYVTNCPGKNATAVAELAVTLILALERQLADNVIELRGGKWNKGRFSVATGLKGKTVGIVGMGQIGQETIERLKGFGVRILAWSRSLTPEKAASMGVEYVKDLLELAGRCDIVSLHLALSSDTRGLISREFLSRMPTGAFLINTSRAEVVDNAALLEMMNEKGLRYGSDVFEAEPSGKEAAYDNAVARHPNCYGTHHIGASTDQAEVETGLEAVRIAEAFVLGSPIPNCVNLRKAPTEGYALTVRHEDRVGVLAGVFNILKEHGLNVQEMENQIFSGAKAASARVLLDSPVPAAALASLTKVEGVLHVRASELTSRPLVTA